MREFHKEGRRLSITSSENVGKERSLEIIAAAISKSSTPDWVPAEFIYDLRFNKHLPRGYEGLWSKASHLITDMKAYATEPGNLNFIFSDDEARLDQWRHFYGLTPLLLYHAVEVAEALIFNIA